MGWGLMRVAIFGIGFWVGLMVVGPLRTSAGSDPSDVMRVNDTLGGSLIVVCKGGDVAIKHVGGESGAIQLECAQGKIVVIRDRRERVRPIPVRQARISRSRFD